jgi:UDP-N-acetylglucosamine 2-epimerase (non-hydrolysing)
MRITVPVGTRPEVIKLAPVVAALRAADHDVRVIATGQHVDPRMYAGVFADLDLQPDAVWHLSGGEGERVGGLVSAAFTELDECPTDAVLVLGDTYTAPTTALAARRHGTGVIHLEAGLRSFNARSVEEVNRRMMVALATVHFAPTDRAAEFLTAEGVPAERIRVVGNPVVDAVVGTGIARRDPLDRAGILFTAHRATNVDDPVRLAELVRVVRRLGGLHGPVTFPVHPRTWDRLARMGWLDDVLRAPGVDACDPLPYEDLLSVLAASRVVVTDSGGLQEEAAHFGVPSVVMRHTTPRWEGVDNGSTVLAGVSGERVLAAVDRFSSSDELARVAALPCPYGKGDTGPRVAAALADPALRALVVPTEPALVG